jgi:hypothetical protein
MKKINKPQLMNIRARIIRDVNTIADKQLLSQLYSYMQLLKCKPHQLIPNREAVISFAGTLTDAEAANLSHTLSREFGQLEGEW